MSYKLTFFDGQGRGEPVRILFALAKVEFIDNRIKKEDWAALKLTTRYGVLPTLHVEGKEIGQHGTILRFLAKRFKLNGADEWEATRCDEIFDFLNDLQQGEAGRYHAEQNEEKKAELKKALLETHIPKFFGKLETMQQENGGSWLVGKNATWSDVYLVHMMDTVDMFAGKDLLAVYTHLQKTRETFLALPQIKSYMEKRSAPK